MNKSDYKKIYNDKLVSAEEAVKCVRSGDWVDYGWITCAPEVLDEALAARYEELEGVNVRGSVLLKRPAIMSVPDTGRHFIWNSWHFSGIDRQLAKEGLAFCIPQRYSELPRYYRENITAVNVAIFQVPPMDDDGYFSFGLNVSHMAALCERAEKIIVEVNRNYPRCCGGDETRIHVSQVDYIVEGGNPPIREMKVGHPGEIDYAIADLLVPEIPNGACLQLGIGAMPNAIGERIAASDLKDLGVHSEMYVDAYLEMAEAGKISGRFKNIDRGLQVYAFAGGTQKLYDYLNENPECLAATVDYVNDARTIAQIDNFISINNAVDIDLFGQISAESSGITQISGAGGQLDFVLGAYLSRGGKSFICLSSTYTDSQGKLHSRIRPTLKDGSAVTDTRANAQYIVTEYGIINLKGASTWERAERIISIAHPSFRDELIREAQQMGIWRR
ncbi:MAG: butyryl-CoA:acetate CoA-transferase [Lachnospiraceae bacterium]|nr:butyryl-CoA:acetate CoA-transferase [Lachnospiraceae bacterium]